MRKKDDLRHYLKQFDRKSKTRRLKMSKKKMSEKELLKLELIEALRLLGEIVTEEEPEDWDEKSEDED